MTPFTYSIAKERQRFGRRLPGSGFEDLHDTEMLKPPEGLGLSDETPHCLVGSEPCAHHLHGDHSPWLLLLGPEHQSHAAGTNLLQNPVVANPLRH